MDMGLKFGLGANPLRLLPLDVSCPEHRFVPFPL